MPIFPSIRTEVDACQVSKARSGTTDNCQHLRVSGTDNNIQYHQCIKLSALLRPATSTISTAEETIVRAKVYDSRFSSQRYLVQVGFRIRERASCNRRVGVIDNVVEYLPRDENRNDKQY